MSRTERARQKDKPAQYLHRIQRSISNYQVHHGPLYAAMNKLFANEHKAAALKGTNCG